MLTEDFSTVLQCHDDGCLVDQHKNFFSGMCCADAHVVKFSCASEGEFSSFVDFVIAGAPVV